MTKLKRNAPTVLLIALVALFIANPIMETSRMPRVGFLLEVIFLVVLSAAVYAECDRFSWKRPGVLAVAIAFALRFALTAWGGGLDAGPYRFFLIGVEIYTAVVVFRVCATLVRAVTRPGHVSGNTVAGIASVYILMSLGFSFLHMAAYVAEGPGAFNGIQHAPGDDPASSEPHLKKLGMEFNYYSIVTQTTLGYGDITPVKPIARGLAIAQTIIGQLFLAIVLARIVAMELVDRQERRPD